MTPRYYLAMLLRSIANIIDPPPTRYLTVGHQRFAMRDDLPFKFKVE